MAQFDLPLDQLRTYRPHLEEADAFDDFWAETLGAQAPVTVEEVAFDGRVTLIDVYDLTFTGYGGAPIKAWLRTPAGNLDPLPTVVSFCGYSMSRGMPMDAGYVLAGFTELVLDSRGQGWASIGLFGDSPDPDPAAGAYGTVEPVAKGLATPETYYYRRLITDAVRLLQVAEAHRLVDEQRLFVSGGSQGGYLALAVAGLAPSLGIQLAGCLPDVPFMCHIKHAVGLTDANPFAAIGRFIRALPHLEDDVWRTLAHFDGVHFARRANCPALFSVGLADLICPPSTVYAAFNAYGSEDKQIEVYPHNGHEGGLDVQHWKQLGWLRDRVG